MTLPEAEHRTKPSTRSIGAIATIAAALAAIAVIVPTALRRWEIPPSCPKDALHNRGRRVGLPVQRRHRGMGFSGPRGSRQRQVDALSGHGRG